MQRDRSERRRLGPLYRFVMPTTTCLFCGLKCSIANIKAHINKYCRMNPSSLSFGKPAPGCRKYADRRDHIVVRKNNKECRGCRKIYHNGNQNFCSKECRADYYEKVYAARALTPRKEMLLSGVARRIANQSLFPKECSIVGCFEKLALHAHHKDKDKTNNLLENLVWLCPTCHWYVHSKKYSYLKHFKPRDEIRESKGETNG